ncbi:hypothetical protein [Dorea sp.]
MSNYSKPMISIDNGMAEGVYAASGDASKGCYTANAHIHQTPQNGRGDYRIQVNGVHSADHSNEAQILTISFNQNVTYQSSQGTLLSGNGTNTLKISYNYHQNPNDDIGLGDLVVTADTGLAITGVSITD